ncbi:MAG: type II secretion system protein GspJ, partial [Pacificimonas sp.]
IDTAHGPDIAWRQEGDRLVRQVRGRTQPVLSGVEDLEVALFQPGSGWRTDWDPAMARGGDWPTAIRVTVQLGDAELSRTVAFAAPPAP